MEIYLYITSLLDRQQTSAVTWDIISLEILLSLASPILCGTASHHLVKVRL